MHTLKQRREALGLADVDVAARVCGGGNMITVHDLRRWESGENTPHARMLLPLAAALETTTDWLLGAEGATHD